MSDTRENLPIPNKPDNGSLNITLEHLQQIWEEFSLQGNDKKENEFSCYDAATLWNIPADTARDRFEKMVAKGFLEKRVGKKNGKRIIYYSKK